MTYKYIINATAYIDGVKENKTYFMTTKNYMNTNDMQAVATKANQKLYEESTDSDKDLPFSYQSDGMNIDTLIQATAYYAKGDLIDMQDIKCPIMIDNFIDISVTIT